MNNVRQRILENPEEFDFTIQKVGECKLKSPIKGQTFVDVEEKILFNSELKNLNSMIEQGKKLPCFEASGPREKIFHDPAWTRAAIVTCGGLCPGLNDVIKGLVQVLSFDYGVKHIFGIRYGYKGLDANCGFEPMHLSPEVVDMIHTDGGSILGSSRGIQPTPDIVDSLQRLNINILFCLGGDGTLRAAGEIADECQKRKLPTSIIGVPKTIDNDLSFIDKTFGFESAVAASYPVITCAHNEAKGAHNGIGLIKIMGRDSGFIAACSSISNSMVNFCLIPEMDFELEGENGLLMALQRRFEKGKDHAVIVVAEGAGQKFFKGLPTEKDASGNILKHDIGLYLKSKIEEHFTDKNPATVKYFDPSYMIRSVAAIGMDAIFCFTLAQAAVHAAMAGKTNMVSGYWNGRCVNVPIKLVTMQRRKVDVEGPLMSALVDVTRQNDYFGY